MSTVIYLFNQKVQIVTGIVNKGVRVQKCHTATAPEGSIINGIVMDEEPFVNFLKETWKEKELSNRDVILVINSSKFIGKTLEIPKVNERKTNEFIRREFADMGRETESVFGYISLAGGEGNLRKIYAEAIEPEFIQDYVAIFGKAGIKLNAIYSGESSLIGFTQKTAALRNHTFDLIIADGMILTTILWINGSFYYYNSTRCFHEPGTLEYADDLARSVSQVIQFLQAHQVEFKLEKVMIAGINIDNMSIYKRAISDAGLQMPVQAFTLSNGISADNTTQNYFHAISGLYQEEKTENFLSQLGSRTANTEKSEKNKTKGSIILIAVILLFMLIATTATAIVRSVKAKELSDLKLYNEAPDRLFDLALYDMYSDRNSYLIRQFDAIQNIEANLATYPAGNEKVLQVFDRCAEGYATVQYESFDSETGTITILAKADDVENINQFIGKLTREEIFNLVDYTGYQYEDETGLWKINVTCILEEGAGKADRR